MKKWLVLFTVFLSVIMTVPTADAKKLGGSRSFGKSYNTAPAKPSAAPSSTQANKSSNTNSANKTQQPQKKSGFFGGMLGGLLAGGLLASLFGGLGGLGGGMGGLFGLLMIGLLAFGLIKVFRSMNQAKSGQQHKSRPHYAGGHGQNHDFEAEKSPFGNGFEQAPAQIRDMPKSGMLPGDAPLPGNEPLTGNTPLSESEPLTGGFSQPGDVPYNLPPNFDMNGFLQGAREHYRTLQQAWNVNNLDTVQDYVSPELFNALKQERATLTGDQHTEVMYVDAELVRADYDNRQAQVSIRFNGRYCDRQEGTEEDINDLWHLERDLTVADAPWYIVGIEG